jgi:protein CsiD
MELHNDGTYVEEQTDYVLMMKIDEQNMQGGNSLLHLDDWEHLDEFSATRWLAARWGPRRRAKTSARCFPPGVRRRPLGRPVMRYIDQFVQPKDFEEGTWLSRLPTRWRPAKTFFPYRCRWANSAD